MSDSNASSSSNTADIPVSPVAEGNGTPDAPKEKKLTAKELRMKAKAEEAAARAAEETAKLAAQADIFGDAPLIQSQAISGKVWTRVENLVPGLVNTEVLVRARIANIRETSKILFITFRQAFFTAQGIVMKSTNPLMFKWVSGLSRESVVDVTATVTSVPNPVSSVSQSDVELQITKLFCVSRAIGLPFQLEDASRPDTVYTQQEKDEKEAKENNLPPPERKYALINPDTRLDNRWIDLRTPANQAIMRISSGVCQLFREYLLTQNFVEIQTPKIIGGASEGGAQVFKLKYFGEDACLAQSPQLYKQMTSACSDFERVFEIGPVFRAENSNTHRHLCEFHGLDMEMVINEHYYEVLDVFSELFIYIFDGLKTRYSKEIEAVRAQHPFEDLQYCKPSLRISYAEGIKMLKDSGVDINDGDDFNTAQERALGTIIKEKYGTDFYMMDKYPASVRPFYTMPDPSNPALSNSYDFFLRGEEIVSGAQRVHDPELLTKQAKEKGIEVHTIQSYVDSFRHGALPHGGGGLGLERIVFLYLGLPNVRKASMFPRDPRRLYP